jgi:hypothetical protein
MQPCPIVIAKPFSARSAREKVDVGDDDAINNVVKKALGVSHCS